jgi:Leucine-rich repeat (LRR) protein
LKWIHLGGNQIESIKTNIFKNNDKLEFIILSYNKIKMMNPNLFINLHHLVEIRLDGGNDCVNSNFGDSDPSLKTLNDSLKNCYNNCLNNDECATNIIVTATTTTALTELAQPEDKFVSQSKFEEFENQTMSKFDFYKIEINKAANELDLLNKKVNVCLTH